MNKDVTASCEACGGLLPLKAIQTRRRGKQRQSRSLHPNQKEPSRGKDSHHPQTEQGPASQSKGARELEKSCLLPNNCKNRSYDHEQFQVAKPSVLEQIQAHFAGQKTEREGVQCCIHGDVGHVERKSNSSEQGRAYQYPFSKHSASDKPPKSLSPADVDATLRHPDQGHAIKETVCKRVVGRIPQDEASNCRLNRNAIHATQRCAHLGEHSKRGQVQGEGTAACSSPTATKEYGSCDGAVEQHGQDPCRSAALSPAGCDSSVPGMEHGCYQDALGLYEECHIHQVDEHITASLQKSATSRESRKSQKRCGDPERGLHTEPQQIIYSCHQHVCHQTVVQHQHREECHLHGGHESAAQSSRSRDSTKTHRCSHPERDPAAKNEVSGLEGFGDHKACHHSSKAYVMKTVRTPEPEVITCAQRAPACKMHANCSTGEVDICGICDHPKVDHKDLQRKQPVEDQHCSVCEHPCKDHESPKREKIQGCHLHREVETTPSSEVAKDPLVWTPSRVRKPRRPCLSVHWLDRIIASKKFPPHIVREFLEGKRRWSPQVKKAKCLGCIRKLRGDLNVSPRDSWPTCCNNNELENESEGWYSGSPVVQRKEQHRGKLKCSRLVMARTLITKPVVKLSTSEGVWTRKEFQVCSECRNPRMGCWSSILEEMCRDENEAGGKSTRVTKFSCCTVHECSKPCDAQARDLHCPALFSSFRLHAKAQTLQNETFDRRTALQVAQEKGIALDKEIFDLMPSETKKPHKMNQAKQESPALRRCATRLMRREVYRGLSKIVEPPNPICQSQYPSKEVAVQADDPWQQNRHNQPSNIPDIWNKDELCPQGHSRLPPMDWSEREQSLEEHIWAQRVETCKQARSMQDVYDSCRGCH